MLAGVKREEDKSSHTGLNWPLLVVPELGSSLHSVSQNSLPQELIVFIARGKNVNFKKMEARRSSHIDFSWSLSCLNVLTVGIW